MKETLTLLERCQREAYEEWNKLAGGNLSVPEILDTLTANTLKQAAESLTDGVMLGSDGTRNCYFIPMERIDALTDAQRLLGEDNETMTPEELEAEGDWDENPEQPFEIEMQ